MDFIKDYLPWWFDAIGTIKTVIQSIITYWFTLRDIFFIILGIGLGILIYRLQINKDKTKVEKSLFKIGKMVKMVYKMILNLTITPLILCLVFGGVFITLLGIYALISLSYRFLGFFIPTLIIMTSLLVTLIIFIKKVYLKEKKGLLKRIFELGKDMLYFCI